MTDVLVYWRDYRQNWIRQFAGDRARHWHSQAKLLGNLVAGDRLWMVTSGKSLRRDAQAAGFLVAVWKVVRVVENPDDDPAYPADEYRYRVVVEDDESLNPDNPVSVDGILRPKGKASDVSIGRFLQGPRKLNEEKVRLLHSCVQPQSIAQDIQRAAKKQY